MSKNVQITAQLHSSHASKVMLKILQTKLQQYVNWELPDVQTGFGKGEEWDQIANMQRIIEKAKEFQKNIYFHFIDYAKAFDSVDPNKLWKILKDMGILKICCNKLWMTLGFDTGIPGLWSERNLMWGQSQKLIAQSFSGSKVLLNYKKDGESFGHIS